MSGKSRTLDPDRITKPIRQRLDTSALKFSKPAPRVKSQPKDGRLIEPPREYGKTKRLMWEKQGRRCSHPKCAIKGGRYLPSPAWGHRHHPFGRGGGRRDDSKTVLWCWICHGLAHPGPKWSKKK